MTPDCRLSVAVAATLQTHFAYNTRAQTCTHTDIHTLHCTVFSINELAGSLAQVLENANDAMLTY